MCNNLDTLIEMQNEIDHETEVSKDFERFILFLEESHVKYVIGQNGRKIPVSEWIDFAKKHSKDEKMEMAEWSVTLQW